MKVYYGFDNIPKLSQAVATMGSYDGVHSGHRELLQQVVALAKRENTQSVVLTFDPHPRYVLGSGANLQLLNTLEEKIYLLERQGIDNLIVVPFTEEFSQKRPIEFIEENILPLGISTLVVGYNHRFGHNKEGDFNYLESRAEQLKIHMVEQHLVQESKVSSTIIRQLIAKGMMQRAAQLLAEPYLIKAAIDQRGEIVNIDNKKLLPPSGTYRVEIAGEITDLIIKEGRSARVLREREGVEIIKFIE